MTLLSSLGSLGRRRSFSSCSTDFYARGELLFFFVGHLLHFGIVGFEKHLVRAGEILFDLLEFAVPGDNLFEFGVLLGDLLEARGVGDELRRRKLLESARRNACLVDSVFP